MKSVPEPHALRNTVIMTLLIVGALSAVAVLIKVPETVSGACLLDPARCWTLDEVRPGSLQTGTEDMLTGEFRNYRLYQFDRPSFVDLSLVVGAAAHGINPTVKAGELLASAYSTSISLEILEEETKLEEARSELEVLKSGAKPEVMEQADLTIKLAETELVAHQRQNQRDIDLNKEGILSDEDFDTSEARLDLLELNVKVARANRLDLASGSRPEEIRKAETTIVSLERELTALLEMEEAMQIRTPIDGQLQVHERGQTLMSVSATDTMAVRVLVPQHKAGQLKVGQEMKIVMPGLGGDSVVGEVLRVNPQINQTEVGPYVTVYGQLVNADGLLVTGMQGKAKIHCGTTTLFKQLKKDMITVFKQEIWSR